MYDDYAFGGGSFTWDAPPAWPPDWATLEPAQLLDWLHEGHAALAGSLASLTDAALEVPRRTNWGELWPTVRIITAMIEHDIYHAGEINHLRATLTHDDAWAYAAG
jgi:hypothetical protein